MAEFMNLEQRKVEQDYLDKVWVAIGEQHQRVLQSLGIKSEYIKSDLKAFSLATTLEHVVEVERQREEILAIIAARAAEQATKKNRKADKTALQTQWGEDKHQSFEAPQLKTKHKTRGVFETLTLDNDSPPKTEKLESNITVVVNKRALSVFRAMFPGNNPEDRPKALDWDTFVNALSEEGVGFVARHSAGGSAHTFVPNEKSLWFGKGAISFHKPHPENVIDAITVMAHGKRMEKWFRWSEKTVILKK
ncbi:hypothetical protein BKA65DRAFT_476562 [Rhexocercosporidium sp. MPI-PUGE-AT-0058]|nr:hypothetical protein BKA65DRAFT_476562 [Rhexocercosporidium sp. MPI-PUGE-AT-0058]